MFITRTIFAQNNMNVFICLGWDEKPGGKVQE
jgi:hypothetical protein